MKIGVFFTMKNETKKTKWWVPVVLSTVFFGGCVGTFFGDHIIGNQRFIALCESETDFRLYEAVTIDERHFLPRPKKRTNERYKLDEIHKPYDDFEYIEVDFFDANYIRIFQEKSIEDEIGPIERYTTKLIRKSDGKVLSEVSSFANQKGWLFRYIGEFIQTSRDLCPTGRDANGYTFYYKLHRQALKNTFVKDIK